MRVVLVDDHVMVREMFAVYLLEQKGFEVVGQTDNGLGALELCRRMRPDLLVIDVFLPDLSGLEVIQQLIKENHSSKYLAVSGHQGKDVLVRLIQLGVHGFIPKTEGLAVFGEAVRAIARGGNYYMSRRTDLMRSALHDPVRNDLLTLREKEVLTLVAEGKSSKEIASRLNMGVKTVETHRTHISHKLNIHDIAGLTRYAIRHSLVECSPLEEECGPRWQDLKAVSNN
jgi:DNA-binding NarL/FixJ family response regulator